MTTLDRPARHAPMPNPPPAASGDGSLVALRVIAAILVVGAAWVAAELLVPFVLALVLAVAFSPLADRMERRGVPRTLAALVCMGAVAAFLAVAMGILVVQASTIAQHFGTYVQRFGSLLDVASRRAGGDHFLGPSGGWASAIERSFSGLGAWAVRGAGGLLGVLGGAVLFLAAMFYMLQTRGDWLERLKEAGAILGMRPDDARLGRIRDEVVTFVGCLAMIACGYVVVVSLALWLIGVPQPLLWGLMAGLFEVVPYFGPLLASVLPTVVALSLGSWWQPAVVAGLFLTLHLVEGYLITPLLYGRAVKFDPLTILFGALFFGWLWGPAGLATAMPMLILVRGLLVLTPNTPALDALADVGPEKNGVGEHS